MDFTTKYPNTILLHSYVLCTVFMVVKMYFFFFHSNFLRLIYVRVFICIYVFLFNFDQIWIWSVKSISISHIQSILLRVFNMFKDFHILYIHIRRVTLVLYVCTYILIPLHFYMYVYCADSNHQCCQIV